MDYHDKIRSLGRKYLSKSLEDFINEYIVKVLKMNKYIRSYYLTMHAVGKRRWQLVLRAHLLRALVAGDRSDGDRR